MVPCLAVAFSQEFDIHLIYKCAVFGLLRTFFELHLLLLVLELIIHVRRQVKLNNAPQLLIS